jgi:16S rRNA (guanine966-N2)-methyltransferase
MGEIRLISGKYRGKLLESPPGASTRPLLSRLRKSLADILRPRLHGAVVLDLFGGTGAIAFELLSNGAERAVIIELDFSAAKILEQNAKRLGAQARVVQGDCLEAIVRLGKADEQFDVIMVAPPYYMDLQRKAMEALAAASLLAAGGVVIVQRDKSEPFWEAKTPFIHEQTRDYGRTVFDFYQLEAGVPGTGAGQR